ncbi:MAG: Exodeoxyribonuclease 7 large subunit [Bacteriovoracaceae bacterium]|nr:Exodeoxyribonuclease 7 large subunit [Bacteriovoracaceae bacterium]
MPSFQEPTTYETATKLTGSREVPLSISELTDLIKSKLERTFSDVVIVGEVSNFKAHPSGHCYFSLKDERAMLSAVMFRHDHSKIKFKMQDGQKVIAFGKITVYPPRGNYQIVLSRVEPDGLGALQLAYEQLKKKLEAEGLFSQDRKRAIPLYPKKVGLVTSSSGAAVRDILQILDRRFSGLHIVLYPVKVQGDGSAEEVTKGIEDFNSFFPEVDVLIVGRGGGSIEDLWAFNEEIVARAIFNSKIPIISAVGHEIDFTIADFVADLRAPTPSAAAELVIANKVEIIHRVDQWVRRLLQIRSKLEMVQMRVDDLIQKLQGLLDGKISNLFLTIQTLKGKLWQHSPKAILTGYRHRLDAQMQRLLASPETFLEKKTWKVEHLNTKLKLLNPRAIMERGYSIVRILETKKVVKKVSDVQMGEKLLIELSKGKITARV